MCSFIQESINLTRSSLCSIFILKIKMADHVEVSPLPSITPEQELRALEEKVQQRCGFDFPHSAENDFSPETNLEVDKMTRPDNVNLDDEGDEPEDVVSSDFPDFDWNELEGEMMISTLMFPHRIKRAVLKGYLRDCR